MKNYISFVISTILALIVVTNINAQSIDSHLSVIISQQKVKDNPFKYYLKVTNTINVNNYNKDTLCLKLQNKINNFTIKEFSIDSLQLRYKDASKKHYAPKIYDFDETILKIPVANRNFDIQVSYTFTGGYFFMFGDIMNFIISYLAISDNDSWYFSCENMNVKEVDIVTPLETTLLSQLPIVSFKANENTIVYKLNTSVKYAKEEIYFALLDNKYYHKVEVYTPLDTINLHFHNFVLDTASKSTNPFRSLSDSSRYQEKKRITRKYVSVIREFWDIQTSHKWDMAEIFWRTAQSASGRAFTSSSSKGGFILVDSFFLDNSGYLHEMLHIYDPLSAFYPPIGDSTRYFFQESLITYLETYLYCNGNEKEMQNKFNHQLISGYMNVQPTIHSIFKCTEPNNNKSFPVVYSKTPFVIHSFAMKIGKEIFIKSLQQFYNQALQKKQVNFTDFCTTFRENKVSEKDLQWFIKSL